MELFYFVGEVFDSEFIPVQVVVRQVQNWKHVYASKESKPFGVKGQFVRKLYDILKRGLYFTRHTCPPRFLESAQCSFDVALRSSLEHTVTASGLGFGDWQWRLPTLPFTFGGIGVYSVGGVLNYAFLASRLQSADLQTKLLRHTSIVSLGKIAAPKLMKKMADIYFTRVTKNEESIFSLSSKQMALWASQREDHTSDWLRTVLISGLGQTMNACLKVFAGDIYGDHAVSCAGIIGIKHRHNVVRDTLINICYCSRISTGKEVDIWLDRGRDKPLRPTDMLLYSWDGGLDVCVDLTGSSPLTQTGMADFIPGRAVIDVAQCKRSKYMDKCAAIGYGFLPFSFSSLGELEADAVRISFAIAKGVGALNTVIHKPDDISCWVSLLALPLCLLKTFFSRSNLECKSAIKRQRQEESIVNAILSWGMPSGILLLLKETLAESSPTFLDDDDDDLDLGERNIKQCKRKICDGHYTAAVRVLSSSRVAPYNEATLEDLKTKHPFHLAPSLPYIPTDHHHLIASLIVVLDKIKTVVAISNELISSITQVVNLFLARNCPQMLGEYIANASLTTLVKPCGGIRLIAVGTLWRHLVSKVSAIMIGHSLDGYLDGLQFGVGVAGGSEAILHSMNRLIEAYGGDVGLSMLLVDFKNAFNLVDQEVMLGEVHLCCPAISRWVLDCITKSTPYGHAKECNKIKDSFSLSLHAWYLDDGTIIGDIVVVGKVLELIMEDGSGCGLHLNVDKTKVFWPKEDPRSRVTGIFPPNIARPLHGVKLLGGPASVDFNFCNELVMKRVSKTIRLIDFMAKINDPPCELLLLRSCTSISRLYFTMCTCPPCFFESAQCSFDVALHSSLEHIVTAFAPGFGDWQWRLATLPFEFGGLGVYSTGDVLNYAFLASRLQSADLQTKLLRHTSIVSLGPNFDDALFVFNTSMETDLLSNSSEIVAPKLMKKMADIYFTLVTKNAESTFSLSPRKMALWTSQMEDHTSDWLRTLGIPLFSSSKPCSACSKVFAMDIYGDHVVLCAGIIGIKHRHSVVRDTLVNICYRSGIFAGLDVCVDLTGSSPLTQTGMVDFIPSRSIIDAAHRKRVKYMDMCAAIGYGFLPFSFSSLGELEADAVTLLKQIRKFSITQDIGARAAIQNFNRISFAIAKGVGAQIVSRLPSNFLMDILVTNATHRKRAIVYGFLPFSFSSLGELDADVVTLLKRIQKFSMAQDIGARAAIHIFNRISFAIAKGVGAR
ncbi:hypothetical protein Tco_0653521 [Tanacetum coccineum]|uniref:Reverse transcriptase domain-containing protein n=1 Tax=Tanacetum coccineum TaxID=301880 RepID=A0ABQ4X0R9_9ASTR